MDRLLENKIESYLRMYANGSCYLQEFIDALRVAGLDLKSVHLEKITTNKEMIVFICVPKGLSAPVTRFTAIKN